VNTARPQNVPSLPAGPARNNDRIIRWAVIIAAVLFGIFAVLVVLAMLVFKGLDAGPMGLLVGIVVATLPVPIYLALALWVDRYEKEPIWMLTAAFLWGIVADGFSYFLNTINGMIVFVLTGNEATTGFFTAVISAPIVEETSKGLALFILYWWKKDEFDNVIDGIMYAAMVGLGFAMAENFGYYGRAVAEGGIVLGLSFVVRGVLSPFLHPIITAMTGIGLGLARQSNKSWVKFVAPLTGLLLAMLLHALWNGSAYITAALLGNLVGLAALVAYLVLTGLQSTLFMIPLLIFVFFALRREGRTVRHYLTPEVQSGLLSQQEYNALGSVSGRLSSSLRALRRGGFGSWRAYSRFAQVATELAYHRDRVSRGITSVDAASREASYIQLLRSLKGRRRDDRVGKDR
jgi:protease PrsW